MPVSFEGVLADRSTWRVDNRSIAMEVVGARSTMLMDLDDLAIVASISTAEGLEILNGVD